MIKIYNTSMVLLAILNNAFNISYTQKFNEVHSASFKMPVDDDKIQYCNAYNFIEIYDNDTRIDLFRIMPTKLNKTSNSNIITFECEHVLSTLLDDVIFGYSLIASTNNTSQVITSILNNQSVENWQLNTCQFSENYEYKFENTNLLNALFQIPKYLSSYQFTWDTSSYPWQLNLIQTSETATCRILYKRNLLGIDKETDPTNLCTRLYGLGSGEGINQVKISSINSGNNYIDSDTIETYGIISKIFSDREIETPAELKAKMEVFLEENKIPKIKYTIKAADIYKITNDSLDKFELGTIVNVYDDELDISFSSRVLSITKNNIIENPGDITLEISEKTKNISNIISNLQSKSITTEMVSQGSSCIDSISIQENCDKDHPGVLKFFLSSDVVFVNKCILNYEIVKFRAYEKSIANGGDSTQTSSQVGETYNTTQGYEGAPSYSTPWTMSAPEHVHFLANHTHDVDIPAHTHDIDYGIYEFQYLPPSITLKVDGEVIEDIENLTGNDINILPYLSTTDDFVDRSTFHTIEIIPDYDTNNPEGLCRIIANVNWKVFIRNHEGSNL